MVSRSAAQARHAGRAVAWREPSAQRWASVPSAWHGGPDRSPGPPCSEVDADGIDAFSCILTSFILRGIPLARTKRRMSEQFSVPVGLLLKLFDPSDYGQIGVNARRFRADHPEAIPSLDVCERIGFIRRDAEKYFITLLGVTQLNAYETREFFDTAENLHHALRIRYLAEPGCAVKVYDLAREVGLDFRQVFQCLFLMRECPQWWEGFCNADAIDDPTTASIVPGEGVLVQPSFKTRVREWESTGRQFRLNACGVFSPALPAVPAGFGSENHLSEELARVLPTDQVILLREVIKAVENELLTLASMGLRAVIDMVCTDQIGDPGGFQKKVDALLKAGIITKVQSSILLTVVDVGNASAHRGYAPDNSDINTVIGVVEDLLKCVYLHPSRAAVLAQKTPARRPKS
jgi:hypothetical protein